MIRRPSYPNNVKAAQVARMHRAIVASIASLQPERGARVSDLPWAVSRERGHHRRSFGVRE